MKIAHLKAKILDLAVRGKLTEQRPEEGSAEELLERIREEKQRLIAEGKLKKEKPLPDITEDEIPFDIPAGWKWVRLESVVEDLFAGGDRPAVYSPIKSLETPIPIYANGVFQKGLYGFTDKPTVVHHAITVSARGTIGFTCIREEPFVPIVRLITLIPNDKLININYFKIVLDVLLNIVEGSSIPQLTLPMIKTFVLSLPPLAEQKRIVEKIEAIFKQADIIEESRLALKTAVRHTKSRVLDLAVRGKLTEQRPEEGSAEELLERIREEKQRLIAEGKLKKEKPLPEITEEEIPFDIPAGWKWVRLPELCTKPITDGTHNSPPQQPKGDFLYITAKNIKEKGIDLSNVSYVTQEIHDLIYSRCNPEKNDVLLTKDGTIGVATVNNLDYPFSLLSSVALIKPVSQLLPWYLTYVLRSSYLQTLMHTDSKGSALRRIILEQINSFIIPLPPLAEQKRIVEKIEQIFDTLDIIKKAVE